ncbi:MAG TPA: hypothetical protein VEO74_11175 [Thermoanaerobaculia bacterium]|nr:hypothetical protein [Thermoanaerobaculia bacterium]
MAVRAHPLFLWIFLLILAPVGAVVVVTLLLLLGVEPRLVFAPGRAVRSFLEFCSLHPANRVAVASTVGVLWAVIAAAGLAWERRRRAA